jgi:hypothetical protein
MALNMCRRLPRHAGGSDLAQVGTVKRCPRALAAARARVAAARLAAMSPSSAYCHTIHSPGWMSDCGMPGGCPPGHNILVSRFTMHIRPRPAALTMPRNS